MLSPWYEQSKTIGNIDKAREVLLMLSTADLLVVTSLRHLVLKLNILITFLQNKLP
jgi:hypothetical protein